MRINKEHAHERRISMKIARARLGINQVQLAKLSGLSRNTISRTEVGGSISDESLEAIEKILGIEL